MQSHFVAVCRCWREEKSGDGAVAAEYGFATSRRHHLSDMDAEITALEQRLAKARLVSLAPAACLKRKDRCENRLKIT